MDAITALDEKNINYRVWADGKIVVQGKRCKIDFWPITGKFVPHEMSSNDREGRGVVNLIKLCE